MADMVLTKTRMVGGVWEGLLTAAEPTAQPDLKAWFLGRAIAAPELSAETGADRRRWRVKLVIPAEVLSDGVNTVVIGSADGETLAIETFVCGDPLEADIRAEIDLLRAELDMLKKAFRRHCLETM